MPRSTEPPAWLAAAFAAALAAGVRSQVGPMPPRLDPCGVVQLDQAPTAPGLPRLRLPLQRFAFSGDGRWLVAMRNDARLLFRDLDRETERTADLDPTRQVKAVLPCTACVEVPVVIDDALLFWSPSLALPVREVRLPAATRIAPLAASVSPDGHRLWTGHRLIDLMRSERPGRQRRDAAQGLFAAGDRLLLRDQLAVLSVGARGVRASLELHELRELRSRDEPDHDVRDRRPVALHDPPVTDVALAPDGCTLLVCRGGRLELWDAHGLELRTSLEIPAFFAQALDARTALVARQEGESPPVTRFGLWDLITSTCWQRQTCGTATGLAVAPGGRYVALQVGAAVEVYRVRR